MPKKRSRADKWLMAAALLPVTVWVLQAVFGERNTIVYCLLAVPPLLYLAPVLLGLLISLRLRKWHMAALSAAVLVGGVFFLGGLALGSQSDTASPKLRVMTFNVQMLLSHKAEEVASLILAEAPDIVFIQEAPLPDKAVYLRKLLKDYNYRQHRLMAIATKKRGQEFTFVEPVKSKYPPIVSMYVYFNDTRVRLVNMHMPAFPQHDLSLVDETSADFGATGLWLREYLAEDVPTIVAGDMNMVQQARFHRELRGLLTDSFAATGLGFGHTIPSTFPMRRIDYIYAGKGLRPVSCRVLKVVASDHLAVVAEISLDRETEQ